MLMMVQVHTGMIVEKFTMAITVDLLIFDDFKLF